MSSTRRRRLPAGVIAAVAAVLLAGAALAGYVVVDRGEAGNGCSECSPPVVAVEGDAVWVAQGTRLMRLDAGTGRVAWERRVTRRTGGGTEEIRALSPTPAGVWTAWRRGAAIVRGSQGPITRVPVDAPAASPSLATVDGRTWLGLGNRVIGLHPDGTAAPEVRVAAPASVIAAGPVLLVRTGDGEVHLDPVLGVRTTAPTTPAPAPSWSADPATGEVTALDTATGAALGDPVRFDDLVTVVDGPDGAGYVVQGRGHMAVTRLDHDARAEAWRAEIPPD